MQNCTSISSAPQMKVMALSKRNQVSESQTESSVVSTVTQFFSSHMDGIVDYSIELIAIAGLTGVFKLQSIVEKVVSLSIFVLHAKIYIDRVEARNKIKNLTKECADYKARLKSKAIMK